MYHIIIICIVIASISLYFSRDRKGVTNCIFMRSLIWGWWAFAKKRQIKNNSKLTSSTVHQYSKDILFLL